MTSPSRIVVWGAGGHALVVLDAIRLAGLGKVYRLVDDVNPDRVGKMLGGVRIAGAEALGSALAAGVTSLIVAIGDNVARIECAERARRQGFELTAVVHPAAVVARGVEVGSGSFVAAGAVINPGSRIGENVIINTRASVGHQCSIEDGVHICPGVTLGGTVEVRHRAWIGLGASVRNEISIGREAVVGVGSAVVSDVEDGVVVYGVPARIVRKVTRRDLQGAPSERARR
jgi:UDP-N-acetylbacillosamine N-acetyltransferase